MSKENLNSELSTSVCSDAKLPVSLSVVDKLLDILHQIAFAPIPMNNWEMQCFVGTAKRLSKEALDEFEEHSSNYQANKIQTKMEYSAIHDKLIISQDELRKASLGIMYAMKKYRQSAGMPIGKREREAVMLTDFDHAEREMICSLKLLGINVNAEWGIDLDLSGS